MSNRPRTRTEQAYRAFKQQVIALAGGEERHTGPHQVEAVLREGSMRLYPLAFFRRQTRSLAHSRSAWRTQLRSVSRLQPILLAIHVIVAHCELCSSGDQTPSEQLARGPQVKTGGSFGSSWLPLSQKLEPPKIPMRFSLASSSTSCSSWRRRAGRSLGRDALPGRKRPKRHARA